MMRLMQEKDCLEVAKLHKKSLEGDYLPTLGVNVLKTIYRGFLKDKKNFGYVVEEDREVIGFTTGSEDTGTMFKKVIKKEFILLSYHVLIALIKKPSLIPNLIQTFRYNEKAKIDTKAEILSLAVREKHRGKGLGRELVIILINDFKKRGFNKLKLTVNKSNIVANKFYQKMGFKCEGTFNIYNKEMNIYTKEI